MANREINFVFNLEAAKAEGNAQKLADALNGLQDFIAKSTQQLEAMEETLRRSSSAFEKINRELGGGDAALQSFNDRTNNLSTSIFDLTAELEKNATAAAGFTAMLGQGRLDDRTEDVKRYAAAFKESYDELKEKTGELSAAAKTLESEMDAASRAMQEGALSPAGAQTLERINAEISKTLELMNKLKNIGGESYTGLDNEIHTAESLTLALTKAEDAKEALLNGGDTSAWLKKYGDDSADAINKILENYEKLKAAEDKRAEQEAKAAERAEKTAEKKLERIDEQAAREAASIEELTAKQQELAAAREKAKAEGSTVDEAKYAEALRKTTAELDRKTKAQERAAAAAEKETASQEKAADAARKSGEAATQSIASLIRAAATGTLTMRGLATAIRGIGAAIKAGLGPIGLGILLVEGLIMVAQKAFDWVTKLWKKNKEEAEAAAKKQQEILDEAIKKAEEARKAYEGFIAEQQEKDALDSLKGSLESVQSSLDEKVKRQREALALALQEAALTQTQEELERKLALAKLEGMKISGEIDEETYLSEKQRIDREALLKKQEREKDELWAKQNDQIAEQNETRTALDLAQKGKGKLDAISGMRSDASRNADNAKLLQYQEELYRLQAEADKWKRFEGTDSAGGRKYANLSAEIWHKQRSIDALKDKNFQELKQLRKAGFADLARIMERQNRTASSTIGEEIETMRAEATKNVEELEQRNNELEAKINTLAARINALPAAHAVQAETLSVHQGNERTQVRKKEVERQMREETERQEKAYAEEEKRRKEAKEQKAQHADTAYSFNLATQNYDGKGRDLLKIFADGNISASEEQDAQALIALAQQNKKLKGIVEQLLALAEKNAERGSKQQMLIRELTLDLNKIKGRTQRLIQKAK